MILSIDIGLKNLSYNIMNATDRNDFSTYKIHLWETYNTLEDDLHICEGTLKNGNSCNRNAKYTVNPNFYCKMHLPKGTVITKKNTLKKKLIKDYLLQDLVTIFLKRMQTIYDDNRELFDQVKTILIELQPKVNPTMQTISHVLYGKFVELYFDKDTKIRFIRANTKLKAYTGPPIECKLKGAYPRRKWFSIQYCRWFLENKFSREQCERWLPVLESGRADNSDTFLYSINAIHGMPKSQALSKKGKCIK